MRKEKQDTGTFIRTSRICSSTLCFGTVWGSRRSCQAGRGFPCTATTTPSSQRLSGSFRTSRRLLDYVRASWERALVRACDPNRHLSPASPLRGPIGEARCIGPCLPRVLWSAPGCRRGGPWRRWGLRAGDLAACPLSLPAILTAHQAHAARRCERGADGLHLAAHLAALHGEPASLTPALPTAQDHGAFCDRTGVAHHVIRLRAWNSGRVFRQKESHRHQGTL